MTLPRIPQPSTYRRHFESSEAVRDVVIGLRMPYVPLRWPPDSPGSLQRPHHVLAGLRRSPPDQSPWPGGYSRRAGCEHYASELKREQTEVSPPDDEARRSTRSSTSIPCPRGRSPVLAALQHNHPLRRLHDALRAGSGKAGRQPAHAPRQPLPPAILRAAGTLLPYMAVAGWVARPYDRRCAQPLWSLRCSRSAVRA